MSWDNRFIHLAAHISSWSKDPSTKVGAVIVEGKNRIVSTGYNGFPAGVTDTLERLEDRETKYKMVIHAEMNALSFARGPVVGCTVYVYPMLPCARCAASLIQAGIKRVVAPITTNPRWQEDIALSLKMFEEAGVEVSQMEGVTA